MKRFGFKYVQLKQNYLLVLSPKIESTPYQVCYLYLYLHNEKISPYCNFIFGFLRSANNY
jgi:hypothetical protein